MDPYEKILIVRASVQFAIDDGTSCMDCLRHKPADATYQTFTDIHYSSYGPSQNQINGIIGAIRQIGLTPKEVDLFMAERGAVEGGKGTKFTEGYIGGCISIADFLTHIEALLTLKKCLAIEHSVRSSPYQKL